MGLKHDDLTHILSNVNQLDRMPDRAIWMHTGQIDFAMLPHKTKVLIAGRGWGKSTMLAFQIFLYQQDMPKSNGFLISLSMTQLRNETMGAIKLVWDGMGLVEGVHYVMYKRPPEHWDVSYIGVKDYKDVVSFNNGTVLCLYSARNAESQLSGGNKDWGIYDEAGLYNRKAFHKTGAKTVRGNPFRYASKFHHQKVIVTSPPRTAEGAWVLEFRESAVKSPHLIHFSKRTAKDNPYLTKAWHAEQYAASPIDYALEVECADGMVHSQDNYYYSFEHAKHTYSPECTWRYGQKVEKNYHPDEPFHLSWDFGRFSGCIALQTRVTDVSLRRNTHYVLKRYFTEHLEKYPHVVRKFTKAWEHHPTKTVYIYGDPTGGNVQAGGDDFYTDIGKLLRAEGWTVVQVVKGEKQASLHRNRRKSINELLAETNLLRPIIRINQDDGYDVIMSIGLTDAEDDDSKDKRLERNKKASQLHAPHFSDMVDNFLEQWRPLTAVRMAGSQKRWGRARF